MSTPLGLNELRRAGPCCPTPSDRLFQDVPRGAQATRQRGYSAPVSGRGRRSWRLATGYRAGPWLWSYETRSWGFPPGAHSYVAGPGLHGEAVCEVGIYGPRFGDPKGIHDD